jgi:hypothetical protein
MSIAPSSTPTSSPPSSTENEPKPTPKTNNYTNSDNSNQPNNTLKATQQNALQSVVKSEDLPATTEDNTIAVKHSDGDGNSTNTSTSSKRKYLVDVNDLEVRTAIRVWMSIFAELTGLLFVVVSVRPLRQLLFVGCSSPFFFISRAFLSSLSSFQAISFTCLSRRSYATFPGRNLPIIWPIFVTTTTTPP